MSQLGLPYKSPLGICGKIYFMIIAKQPGKMAGSIQYTIRAYETYGDGGWIPIHQYIGFYNSHKEKFILYPNRRLNTSFLDYPFVRRDINALWVYDGMMWHDLPPELRVNDLREVSSDVDLGELFGMEG